MLTDEPRKFIRFPGPTRNAPSIRFRSGKIIDFRQAKNALERARAEEREAIGRFRVYPHGWDDLRQAALVIALYLLVALLLIVTLALLVR